MNICGIRSALYMAFRFHPESLYKVDGIHNKIFEEFIKVCSIKE